MEEAKNNNKRGEKQGKCLQLINSCQKKTVYIFRYLKLKPRITYIIEKINKRTKRNEEKEENKLIIIFILAI